MAFQMHISLQHLLTVSSNITSVNVPTRCESYSSVQNFYCCEGDVKMNCVLNSTSPDEVLVLNDGLLVCFFFNTVINFIIFM